MTRQPDLAAGRISVLIDPHAAYDDMHDLTAALALRGPVTVFDGGSRFDPYRIARALRRETVYLDDTLGRITYARAFTCYQMAALAAAAPPAAVPHLVLDLLATFADENVSHAESGRLLRQVVGHLRRLAHYGPVVVSLRPPPQPARAGLIHLVTREAHQVLERPPPPARPRQRPLL